MREDAVINPAKKRGIYGVVEFKNIAVGVVVLDDRDRVLLVGQYRYPLSRYSWEIPEGGCQKGEKPLAAAKRELIEETGFTARHFKKILEMHLSNSSTDERAIIYLATHLRQGVALPEETEVLKLKWLNLKDALKRIDRGEITDSMTVAGLLRVAALRRN